MRVAKTISRKKGESSPVSFEGLRAEGLSLVQALSGDLWTDYNIHDPGVTILEQLSYAITDLIYRTDFPLQDYLTAEDGTINLRDLALYPPQDILPCRATTTDDIRKVILDAVDAIENVWISEAGGGVYDIAVQLAADTPAFHADEIIEKVRDTFYAIRNLCEDIGRITVLDEIEYELEATIDISADADPAELVARIYYESARYIAAGVTLHAYEDLLGIGINLERIFDGPLTRRGVIDRQDLHQGPGDDRGDLFSIVRGIPGVEQIRRLDVRLHNNQPLHTHSGVKPPVARLRVPRRTDEIKVTLFKGTSVLPVSLPAVVAHYNKLAFRHRSLPHGAQDPGAHIRLPEGRFRDFAQYSTIQNDFPPAYGINAYGLPESAPAHEHARALQLKTYLLLFEQIMANFLANLNNMGNVFTVRDTGQSYFAQPLDNSVIAGIEAVATEPAAFMAANLLRDSYDRFKYADRKTRALDYQLAMYGDSFTQFSLRQFDCYHEEGSREQTIIQNKIELLRDIVSLNRDRAAGLRLGAPSWDSAAASGLARKVRVLLGLPYAHERSLTDVFVNRGLDLVPDGAVTDAGAGTGPDATPGGAGEDRVSHEYVPLRDIAEHPLEEGKAAESFDADLQEHREGTEVLFREVPFLKNRQVTESILRLGIDDNRYAVVSDHAGEHFRLALNVAPDPENSRWWSAGVYRTARESVEAANALRRLLIGLNVESEGLHVVEHILLRPPEADVVPGSFHYFRISVVLPSWTARFHDGEFQKLAEDAVRLNCPAHICPEFHWLGFREMREFEMHYMNWLQVRSGADASGGSLDAAAESLMNFLQRHGSRA